MTRSGDDGSLPESSPVRFQLINSTSSANGFIGGYEPLSEQKSLLNYLVCVSNANRYHGTSWTAERPPRHPLQPVARHQAADQYCLPYGTLREGISQLASLLSRNQQSKPGESRQQTRGILSIDERLCFRF